MRLLLNTGAALIALTAAGALCGQAEASSMYGKISAGEAVDSTVGGFALNDGLTYEGAIGGSAGPVRIEAGVGRTSIDLFAVGQGHAVDYSVTAYVDLPHGVFVGLGGDYIEANVTGFGPSLEANGDGWHYAVGYARRLTSDMIGEVQLRHTEANLDFGFGDLDVESDALTVGVRFAI